MEITGMPEEIRQEWEQGIRKYPGAFVRRKAEEGLPVVFQSDGFQTLSGYALGELWELFQGRFTGLICEEDRAEACRSLKAQLASGNQAGLEYRIRRKDGSVRWVSESTVLEELPDGQRRLNSVLTDITVCKGIQERLRQSENWNRIVLNQTTDIIFEWDIPRDHLEYTQNWKERFGYEPIAEHISVEIPRSGDIFPEDLPKFQKLLKDALGGVPNMETELRIRRDPDGYLWCRIRATVLFDNSGQPYKAVGVLVDIDREKKREQALQEKAQLDALTGVYNRGTAESLIGGYLRGLGEKLEHALFILDIDNFKTVNDSYGHLFGDAVLSDIAKNIQKLFRKTDIIGRIGGDEFVVFVKNIPSAAFALQKAQEISDAFRRSFTGERKKHQISGSVGIAYYPSHGTDYRELYRKADRALYHAKEEGKNRCCVYTEALEIQAMRSRFDGEDYSAVRTRIESEETETLFKGNITQTVFRLLYEATDMDVVVNLILEIAGRHYDVSRAYIFEGTEDGNFFSNTYEWCNDGVLPEISRLQNLKMENYYDHFNANGVFYCRDVSILNSFTREILRRQNICSILQCAIREDGVKKGFVGFDQCDENRLWTQHQIDTLSLIAEILSTFLLKKRTQQKLAVSNQIMKIVLDHLPFGIYAIDPENYELLFFNRYLETLLPAVREGITCHFALNQGQGTPCSYCPVKRLNDQNPAYSCELWNPVRKVWELVSFTKVQWPERGDAVLVGNVDITKYMGSGPGPFPDGSSAGCRNGGGAD